MGGWFAFGLLTVWFWTGTLASGPSDEQIEKACAGHGKVVSYESWSMWSVDADPRVVCSNGKVRKVDY